MKIKNHIPNFITCLNLIVGFLAIVFIINGQENVAPYLLLVAAVFDFLDGFFAKILKAHSEIGKQLDSLADLVSFGVLPALIAYRLIENNVFGLEYAQYLKYIVILIPVFSALRLAKFNLDDNQKEAFIGLPTPANALFWAFLFIDSIHIGDGISQWYLNPIILSLLVFMSSVLMILPIPMISLKPRGRNIKLYLQHLFLFASAIILISIFGYSACIYIFIIYILVSQINPSRLNLK